MQLQHLQKTHTFCFHAPVLTFHKCPPRIIICITVLQYLHKVNPHKQSIDFRAWSIEHAKGNTIPSSMLPQQVLVHGMEQVVLLTFGDMFKLDIV